MIVISEENITTLTKHSILKSSSSKHIKQFAFEHKYSLVFNNYETQSKLFKVPIELEETPRTSLVSKEH